MDGRSSNTDLLTERIHHADKHKGEVRLGAQRMLISMSRFEGPHMKT